MKRREVKCKIYVEKAENSLRSAAFWVSDCWALKKLKLKFHDTHDSRLTWAVKEHEISFVESTLNFLVSHERVNFKNTNLSSFFAVSVVFFAHQLVHHNI